MPAFNSGPEKETLKTESALTVHHKPQSPSGSFLHHVFPKHTEDPEGGTQAAQCRSRIIEEEKCHSSLKGKTQASESHYGTREAQTQFHCECHPLSSLALQLRTCKNGVSKVLRKIIFKKKPKNKKLGYSCHKISQGDVISSIL